MRDKPVPAQNAGEQSWRISRSLDLDSARLATDAMQRYMNRHMEFFGGMK